MLTILLLAFTVQQHSIDSVKMDSIGRHLKTITTPAQFVSFDKNDQNRFFFRNMSDQMVTNALMGAPEMDCFLANHTKDDLKVTYAIYTRENAGKEIRTNVVTRIVSLKTGDDTKTWALKEASDSTLAIMHHAELQRAREQP